MDILILIFDGVELLDMAGPLEVFTTASRVALRLAPQAPAPFAVRTASPAGGVVRSRAGLHCSPDSALDATAAPDVLLVPGGVMDGVLRTPETLKALARIAGRAKLVASVCTGVFALARAGIVRHERVATHWEDRADLAQQYPGLDVAPESERWVDAGRLVTSAGIAAGLDMSLYLVARLAGSALAQATARQMDYPWQAAGA